MPKIKCKCCAYQEEANKEFFVKLIGGSAVGFGGYAWVKYIFAGTGFARPICFAIVTGGVIILAFSDQIIKWVSTKFDCPTCGQNQWELIK
ncbi:hypothetical protein VXS05_16910 [Photobacterium toruni]|uniref:hypothetical protein n=1 Tax=Photobacterium toruni TaxID=1935446 RepID=UPI002E19BD44|nr:hypothetical protein [Photobacterium toruni]